MNNYIDKICLKCQIYITNEYLSEHDLELRNRVYTTLNHLLEFVKSLKHGDIHKLSLLLSDEVTYLISAS